MEDQKLKINNKKSHFVRYLIISIIAWIPIGLLIQIMQQYDLVINVASQLYLLWIAAGFILFSSLFLLIAKRIKQPNVGTTLILMAASLLSLPTMFFIGVMELFGTAYLLYSGPFSYSPISIGHADWLNGVGPPQNYILVQIPQYAGNNIYEVPQAIPIPYFIIITVLTAIFIICIAVLAIKLRKS